MSQGRPEKAGTKHSIYRHLNTESGYYTVDEIALIPQIIAEGSRDVSDKKAVYTMYKDGIRYRVVTDIKGNKEVFNTFYTNRKAVSSTSPKTQLAREPVKILLIVAQRYALGIIIQMMPT